MVRAGNLGTTRGKINSNAQSPHPDFVTDQNGTRKAVILSLEDYQELLENLDDLGVVAERQSEETVPNALFDRSFREAKEASE